jgi:iron complex outermembrane receptor protein
MLKAVLSISVVCAGFLYGDEVDLGTIEVEASIEQEVVKDIHGEDIKSADVAEALFRQSPSVSLKRRSGIANDIIVRGQVKDNITVTIDGAKVCGACPNRMDPPISHILANNIDYITINQGPFDVEEFGSLSAGVKVHTIKPTKDIHGDLNLNVGSFGYQKGAFSLTGGTDNLRFLLSGSMEVGEQYEDGDGNNFVGQIDKNIKDGKVSSLAQFQPQYQDMDAFSKDTVMAKIFWDITDNQELRLSYTANRSDDILYPSSKMDAIKDDSDIYNLEYIAKNLGEYSKELNLQLYQTEVEHPMSTKYRMFAIDKGFEMTHALTTKMQGAKIKNSFDMNNHSITAGLDYSVRNWDGGYYKDGIPFPEAKFYSIYDVDTTNIAPFVKDVLRLDKVTLDMGLRYDDTEITSANIKQQSNDYSQLNGYITAKYAQDDTKYFAGVGKSSRVPDAKELYWIGSMGNSIGTPNLDETINYEIDFGLEKQFDNLLFKTKIFYSMLNDYIAYNSSNVKVMNGNKMAYNAYENVDATIYGIEISGSYIATESIYFDYGLSYQVGEKDEPLSGQVGTNMADIPPLKFNLALNYDYDDTLNLKAEVIGADSWSDYDYENGEQELDSYAILNLKATKLYGENYEFSVGVDNVFDETYAVSNTYNDLILLSVPNNEVMLLNETGRYFYANFRYKF